MIRIILLVLVFVFQIFLVIDGVTEIGKELNPYLIFGTSLILTYLYFDAKLTSRSRLVLPAFSKDKWINRLIGLGIIGLSAIPLSKLIIQYPDYGQFSDVIGQIVSLYERYKGGTFPYEPVHFPGHSPFPVYMPMHWLPVGISDALNIDVRWSGFIVLVLAVGIVSGSLMKVKRQIILPAIILVTLPLWGFLFFEKLEISLSYELIIVAYYLILAAGLLERNLWLIGISLLLIILSRYTLIFWVPTLAILLLIHQPFAKSVYLWGTIAAGVVLVYVMPFLLKQPDIFLKGIQYHQQAVVAEWQGYGEPPVSYSMEKGIHFAGTMKRLLSGTWEHQVLVARKIQAGMLLITMALGLLAYFFRLRKLNYYDFSLGMLYVFLMVFFSFSPLTYLYYLLVPLVIGGVLVADVWTDRKIAT